MIYEFHDILKTLKQSSQMPTLRRSIARNYQTTSANATTSVVIPAVVRLARRLLSRNPDRLRVCPNILRVLLEEPTRLDQFSQALFDARLIVRTALIQCLQRPLRQRHLRAPTLTESILCRRLPLPPHAIRCNRHVDEDVSHAALRVAVLIKREERI